MSSVSDGFSHVSRPESAPVLLCSVCPTKHTFCRSLAVGPPQAHLAHTALRSLSLLDTVSRPTGGA